MGKGDLEVYGVVGGGRLDYVVFEDGFLKRKCQFEGMLGVGAQRTDNR